MTHADRTFSWLMLASLAAHAALVGLLSLASGGSGRHNRVQIYSVQIIEAPAPPEARVLPLEPPVSQVPLGIPLAPPAPTDQRPVPPTIPVAPAKAPALPVPAPPKMEGDTQVSLKTPPASLPPLPGQPAPAGSSPVPHAPRPVAPVPRETDNIAPQPARPMERLRSKVERIRLQVESPPKEDESSSDEDKRSALDLRLFHNTVRERVQKNYSFPGTFAPTLKARVRVVVARDGTQRAVDLLQSSGDSRFDNLVCIAAIRNSRLPPVPDSVEGDTVTLTLTCSP